MSETLKPCPFCGGPAYRTESVNGTSMLYVGCASCGIAFKAALVPNGPSDFVWSKDIVSAWNKRCDADLSKTQRNLERLEEICKIHVDNRHLLIVERKEASAILAEYEKGKEV